MAENRSTWQPLTAEQHAAEVRRHLPVSEFGYGGRLTSRPEPVQYPNDVCDGHEYGSEWPCTGCGK